MSRRIRFVLLICLVSILFFVFLGCSDKSSRIHDPVIVDYNTLSPGDFCREHPELCDTSCCPDWE